MTASKFATIPDVGKVFCTGDLAKQLADGSLLLLGRQNQLQVELAFKAGPFFFL